MHNRLPHLGAELPWLVPNAKASESIRVVLLVRCSRHKEDR